ncbi:MAG: SDR family oxidoreductase [Bacilli bacterium]
MKKIYVVTGGSGGIGLDAAKAFKGNAVMILDVNEAALATGKQELEKLGIEAYAEKCDVTNKENVQAVAEKAAKIGQIAGIIHTAGVSGTVTNPDLVLKVDLVGTENIIEGFYPYLQKGSAMVLIASMMAYTIPANSAYDELLKNPYTPNFYEGMKSFHRGDSNLAYNFAKRGVQLLAEKWAPKYGEKGARITSISPGIIETPMALKASEEHPEQMAYMKSLTPMKRNGNPADITAAIVFLCGAGASFISGTDLRVDGGLIKTLLAQKH